MTTVGFVFAKLSIQLADRDVRIPAVVITDPLQLLFGMGIGVRGMRLVGFVLQGFPFLTSSCLCYNGNNKYIKGSKRGQSKKEQLEKERLLQEQREELGKWK